MRVSPLLLVVLVMYQDVVVKTTNKFKDYRTELEGNTRCVSYSF